MNSNSPFTRETANWFRALNPGQTETQRKYTSTSDSVWPKLASTCNITNWTRSNLHASRRNTFTVWLPNASFFCSHYSTRRSIQMAFFSNLRALASKLATSLGHQRIFQNVRPLASPLYVVCCLVPRPLYFAAVNPFRMAHAVHRNELTVKEWEKAQELGNVVW